ncbi:DNA polymerase I [Gulosibacter chungangensis]|uniref:DNA polymerase I n=1 Tax=Gulosibacter chungangensis TaxID=979746 RepID=A0A7J5BDX0_9MICO|nr:DNA polymerase I [Gulosibacter chungangensis]KAB1644252.1 DNA polymerase I [Gulosibacter chungangensis]
MVIDGHSLAFRAFFALPTDSFVNSEGQHTNAIHGFISMLLSLLRDHNPSHIAVAFDAGSKSFRNREFEDYKGGRDETPPEFKGQIELLQESLSAMGITWMQKDDFEADDILATLASQGEHAGYDVLVVSGDRDAIQLVNEETTLLYPSVQGVSKLTRYTPEAVFEKYGVYPQQYPELAAMVGEKADNLPGIPKVGPKTAAKWIAQFGSLDEILARQDELTGKVGESFREHRENAVRNRKLNRLLTDVELPHGPNDLTIRPIDVDAVRDIFTRLQFRTLQDRVLKLATERDGAVVTADTSSVLDEVTLLDALEGDALAAWLEQAEKSAPEGLGITIDFVDGQFTEAGIASATEAARIVAGADNTAFFDWLKSDAPKLTFEGKDLYKQALTAGIDIGGAIIDGKVAAFLVNPTGVPKRLAELVQQYLGETLPETDPNQLISLEEEATNFTASDAWFTKRATQAAIDRLPEVTKPVFFDIESPLVTILGDMEHTGIAIDSELLSELSAAQGEQIAKYEAEAFSAVGGERFNLGSPKQLQTVLFEQLNMPKTRRTKTGYSTDAQALEELEQKNPHPFLGALRHHRDATKLKQIMDSLIKAVADDGRIHTTYQQTAAATGRLASTDPNLQNIPIRSLEGQRIREAFVTSGDYVELLTADYSQIEMRIMAHLSGDESLIDAFNRHEDTHRYVGSQVFGVAPDAVTPEMRTKVKAMSYGLVYGLSAFGLSKQLGISQGEAKDLMTEYFGRFGKVRDYLRDSVAKAKEDGYTETIFGRRRPFPDLNSNNRVARQNAERAALNAPIQGSAADIIKLAMIKVDERMRAEGLRSRMLLQVHDELVFEVVDGEFDALEQLVRDAMANAAELSVPLDVSVGRGKNWQTAGH